MEEVIKRAYRMDDLIDYQSLSLFLDVRLPPKFKMLVLDKFDGIGCPKSLLKMYTRAMQPLGAIDVGINVPKYLDWSRAQMVLQHGR